MEGFYKVLYQIDAEHSSYVFDRGSRHERRVLLHTAIDRNEDLSTLISAGKELLRECHLNLLKLVRSPPWSPQTCAVGKENLKLILILLRTVRASHS